MSPLRLLLHTCCAPCATYTVQHWQDRGFEVTGYWFNPNIHPYAEHEKRRQTFSQYARELSLPVIWEPGYAMPEFLRAIAGQERYGDRCRICYRLRLERTARVAADRGMEAVSTTLLISPYQDQDAIRQIGEEVAAHHGLLFCHDNLRRGYSASRRMAREHSLYLQRYCGCVYSEWESQDQWATTRSRPTRRGGGGNRHERL